MLQRGAGEDVVNRRSILSLCDFSGAWSQPYVDAGYCVTRVDISHPKGLTQVGTHLYTLGADIAELSPHDFPHRPWAVMAAPPCTTFCRPGARWWKRMDERGETERDIRIFTACWQLCTLALSWWALENPPGRQRKLMPEIPAPAWQFQPWEYGDPWIKQTYIWGEAVKPAVVSPVTPEPTRRTPNGRSQGRIAFMSSSWKREREKTPAGFSKAFAEVNP